MLGDRLAPLLARDNLVDDQNHLEAFTFTCEAPTPNLTQEIRISSGTEASPSQVDLGPQLGSSPNSPGELGRVRPPLICVPRTLTQLACGDHRGAREGAM